MKTQRFTVTTDASPIASVGTRLALVRNAGAVDCYVGGADVTSSNGLLLAAGDVLEISKVQGTLYAITASSTTTLHLLHGASA